MNQTVSQTAPREQFAAHLTLDDGTTVAINSPTLAALGVTVSRLRPTEVQVVNSIAETDANRTKAAKDPVPEKAGKAPKSEPAAPAADTASAGKKDDAPAKDDVLPYTELQKAVFALAALSSDAVREVIASLGVKHAKEVAEGDRRKALAAVQARIKVEENAAEAAEVA